MEGISDGTIRIHMCRMSRDAPNVEARDVVADAMLRIADLLS